MESGRCFHKIQQPFVTFANLQGPLGNSLIPTNSTPGSRQLLPHQHHETEPQAGRTEKKRNRTEEATEGKERRHNRSCVSP